MDLGLVGVGHLAVRALRVVLGVVFIGALAIQAGLVWTLVSGADPEGGSLPLTAFRLFALAGLACIQVAVFCVWRLAGMVRRGTVFSGTAFRYVDGVIGATVAAGSVWFAVTAVNAPGQRDDPGVTAIMGGIGLAIIGVALVVLVLRMLLTQAVARDAEVTFSRE